MLELLKDRIVFKIWFSRTLSSFGDVFFDIFVTWKVYERSQDAKDLVVLLGSSFVLRSFFAVVAGKISDSFSRRKVLIFSDVASMIMVLPFVFVYRFGFGSLLPYLFLFLFKNFFVAVFDNAFTAFIADVVKLEKLVKVQSLLSTSSRIIGFVGSALSGVLVAFLPFEIVVILDSLTFLISASLYYTIKYDNRVNSFDIVLNCPKGKLRHGLFDRLEIQIRSSFNFIKKNLFDDGYIMFFCFCIFLLNLVYGYIPFIFPFILSSKTSYGPIYLGILRSVITVGEIMGLMVVAKHGNNVSKCFSIGLLGTIVSVAMLAFPFYAGIVIVISYFFYGFFDSITQPYFSYTIGKIDTKVRGRVVGIIDMIILFASPLGMALGTKLVSIDMNLGIFVLSGIMIFVLILFRINKHTQNIIITENV